MASLEDVGNDIKAVLQDVKNNTAQTNTELNDVLGAVNTLINVDEAGFVNLSTGLAVLIDRANETVALLDDNRKQNDTIICWLTHVAEIECKQLHVLETSAAAAGVDGPPPAAARGDRPARPRPRVRRDPQRRGQPGARVARCCPPDVPEPTPCFEPCPSPKYRPYKRDDVQFEPLHRPQIG